MGWERAGGEAVGLFDAVILDHDGTIVDSRDAMVRAYTRWAGEYGVSLNEMPKYMGMPSRALAEALVPDAKHWDEAAERIEELEARLIRVINDLHQRTYSRFYLGDLNFVTEGMTIERRYGTALAALCFTDFIMPDSADGSSEVVRL